MNDLSTSDGTAVGDPLVADGGMPLSLITLHLARCEAYPTGNRRSGYQILAPRDPSGHIDALAWARVRNGCLVRRFRDGEEDRHGRLVHRQGGRGGATWRFVYVGFPELSEAARGFQDHTFSVGDYVCVSGDDDVPRTFRVADVVRLPPNAPDRVSSDRR